MKKKLTFVAIISTLVPTLTYAQDATTGLTNLGALIRVFTTSVVQSLAYLMLTMAVVAFFFGIVQYIWGIRQGDGAKAKTGSNFMVWGLIALFVMFSVWGIVTYAQRILGIQGQTTITIPDVQFKTTGSTNTQSPFTGGAAGANAGASSNIGNCPAGWHFDSLGNGCVPNAGQPGSVTTQSCGASNKIPNADNSACIADPNP